MLPWGGISGGTKFGPSSAPTKFGSSKLLKAVFIGAKELESLCLGYVGNKSQFCIACKLRGESDCGVSSHKKSKMSVTADTFWVPGGFILNKPIARSDFCLPCNGLSEGSLAILTETLHSEARWSDQFKLIMDRTTVEELRRVARAKKSSGSRSSEVESVYSGSDARHDSVRGGGGGGGGAGSESEVEPDDDPMDDDMGITVPEEVAFDPLEGWEVACGAMQEAVNKMASTIASQAHIIAQLQKEDIWEDVETIQENSAVLQSQVGDLYDIVQTHGTLSIAMAKVMGSWQQHKGRVFISEHDWEEWTKETGRGKQMYPEDEQ